MKTRVELTGATPAGAGWEEKFNEIFHRALESDGRDGLYDVWWDDDPKETNPTYDFNIYLDELSDGTFKEDSWCIAAYPVILDGRGNLRTDTQNCVASCDVIEIKE